MLSELHEKEPVQTKAEVQAESDRKMGQRDGEIYKALSYFIIAVGIPVLMGTYFAAQPKAPVGEAVGNGGMGAAPFSLQFPTEFTHAAVINLICSLVLLSIGVAFWVYGGVVLTRHKKPM